MSEPTFTETKIVDTSVIVCGQLNDNLLRFLCFKIPKKSKNQGALLQANRSSVQQYRKTPIILNHEVIAFKVPFNRVQLYSKGSLYIRRENLRFKSG